MCLDGGKNPSEQSITIFIDFFAAVAALMASATNEALAFRAFPKPWAGSIGPTASKRPSEGSNAEPWASLVLDDAATIRLVGVLRLEPQHEGPFDGRGNK